MVDVTYIDVTYIYLLTLSGDLHTVEKDVLTMSMTIMIMIIITNVQSNLAKGLIADMSPLVSENGFDQS